MKYLIVILVFVLGVFIGSHATRLATVERIVREQHICLVEGGREKCWNLVGER
jgi:hypothetical protein